MLILVVLGCEKTKPILWFIVRSLWFMARTSKGDLKKQSQFLQSTCDGSVLMHYTACSVTESLQMKGKL
jgi:hypothetical protein